MSDTIAASSPANSSAASAARAFYVLPLAVLASFAAIILYGHMTLRGGVDDPALVRIALVFAGLAVAGGALRYRLKSTIAAAWLVEAFSLFILLSLFAALASAVLAVGAGAYVDPALAAADKVLFPGFDWRSTLLGAASEPGLWLFLNLVYVTLNYQPFAFMLAASAIGKPADHCALLTAWAVALAGCILPFHYLPAQDAYIYYGIQPSDIAGLRVTLAFDSIVLLQELRSGTMDTLTMRSVNGLVTIPSFHAAGAVVLGWVWWRFRPFRWPMVFLNAAMAIAAVPVGGHYIVDIVAGAGVGLIAIAAGRAVSRRWPDCRNAHQSRNRLVGELLPA